ncbi:ABC transporter permease [Sphingomonas sp. AP4-R1]|uniref:ABC transporter permease n=1 Tax=Sphingomonas sp. AP4-R1 TaxID=2735134 RepID=UPI001493C399|nr:ABC transporter permease [Sphingomonas sp. AP4-R1]QJU57629.1 ABC transporter permease [Sphingomonas sp. AP4-R1]
MSTRAETSGFDCSTSLAQSFEVQRRVIGALIMRELHTRYGRENVGYLWMFLEPMLLAGAVAGIHGVAPGHIGTDILPVPFSLVGYGIFIIFRGIFGRAEGTLETNRPLLYHRMVTVFDMLAARALLESAAVCGTVSFLLLMACLFDLSLPPARPLWLIAGAGYMVWFSWAMSMICCAATHENRLVARLVHPMTYLFMPIAGGFYMMKWVPRPYRDWLGYLPTTHIFEMCRYGQFESLNDTYVDVTYLTLACLELTLIGILSIKLVRKHVHLS